MRVAFIGSGLQTRRRAPIVVQSPDDELVEVVGTEANPPKGLMEQLGGTWGSDWRRTVERKDIDAIVVCTPPNIHAEISIAALQSGKHVLCEKPLCRTLQEAQDMVAAARASDRLLKCGFNHRHHPAIWEARTALRPRRFRTADCRTLPLWNLRPARLRERMARRSGAGRRRSVRRTGRARNRSIPLVSRGAR